MDIKNINFYLMLILETKINYSAQIASLKSLEKILMRKSRIWESTSIKNKLIAILADWEPPRNMKMLLDIFS